MDHLVNPNVSIDTLKKSIDSLHVVKKLDIPYQLRRGQRIVTDGIIQRNRSHADINGYIEINIFCATYVIFATAKTADDCQNGNMSEVSMYITDIPSMSKWAVMKDIVERIRLPDESLQSD